MYRPRGISRSSAAENRDCQSGSVIHLCFHVMVWYANRAADVPSAVRAPKDGGRRHWSADSPRFSHRTGFRHEENRLTAAGRGTGLCGHRVRSTTGSYCVRERHGAVSRDAGECRRHHAAVTDRDAHPVLVPRHDLSGLPRERQTCARIAAGCSDCRTGCRGENGDHHCQSGRVQSCRCRRGTGRRGLSRGDSHRSVRRVSAVT